MIDLDQYVGQSIEVEDISNLDQCFDWAFFVCDLLNIPRSAIRMLYAKDIWTRHDPAYFDIVQGPPQPLDFAIWGSKVGVAGHVAVVKEVRPLGFVSWDQNWNAVLKVQVVNHDNFGLLGFLRPKGVEMPVLFNEGDRANINVYLYGSDLGRFKDAVGKEWKDAMYFAIFETPEYKTDALVNEGDVPAINEVYGATDGQVNVGHDWKWLFENFATSHRPPGNELAIKLKADLRELLK